MVSLARTAKEDSALLFCGLQGQITITHLTLLESTLPTPKSRTRRSSTSRRTVVPSHSPGSFHKAAFVLMGKHSPCSLGSNLGQE